MSQGDLPSLDDLFRRPNEAPAPGAVTGRQLRAQGWQRARELQAAYGGLDTPRMQQARERAAEALREAARQEVAPAEVTLGPPPQRPAFMIDWYNANIWKTPEGDYPIAQMVDQHLWNTVIWCVRNVEGLYQQYEQVPELAVVALASRKWLRVQTAFRALVRESLRRQLAFPTDVAEYVRRYLLSKDDELTTYEPWNDPGAKRAQLELQAFMQQPVVAEEDYGKNSRSIEL